jgi:hypothetical protein
VFDTFYVTNTNPEVASLLMAVGAPFEVLDISPLIGAVVTKCFRKRIIRRRETGTRSIVPSRASQHNVVINTEEQKRRLLVFRPNFDSVNSQNTIVDRQTFSQLVDECMKVITKEDDDDDIPDLVDSDPEKPPRNVTIGAFNTDPSYDQKVMSLDESTLPTPEDDIPDLVESSTTLKVVLCSQSSVKRRAVERALAALNAKAAISTVKIKSDAPKQPIGFEELIKSCNKRIPSKMQRDTLYIIIESGLVTVEETFVERSVIILSKDGGTKCFYTKDVDITRYEHLLPQVLLHDGKVTLGELIHAHNPIVPADEWYDRVGNISDALVQHLAEFI